MCLSVTEMPLPELVASFFKPGIRKKWGYPPGKKTSSGAASKSREKTIIEFYENKSFKVLHNFIR